ncbi:polysaccharide biosynthesis tyrosine autokinase [Blastococcus tunisiensis]|uniref:non-specific protein-tyrosine kinase n=1 Tax=Blastococcus tunisiensis TaxID=1798228 RepID=A0A1I1YFS7_9ACTN|nr:polysaccharide biosynthesis tyrosine autokinase [Blastococcus sp. DSM 46838]SFE18455.1 capsular exopolysaccharide family [Blastococcus sp. DSM 46838]
MDPRAVWSALRQGWKYSVAGLVLGALLGFGVGFVVGPSYSTSMQFFVSTTESASTSEAFQGSQLAQQRVASYADLLTGKELGERVARRLDSDMAPEELASKVSASTVTGTILIDVTVSDSTPDRAEEIAEAIGIEFPELVADLENPTGDAQSPVYVAQTDKPGAAFSPSPPLTVRNALFGGVLGLLAGAALAITRVLLDRSVTNQEDVEELTGAPVIGVVFRDDALDERHTFEQVESRTAEHYRQLRTNLQFLSVDDPPEVIMVSSSVPAEGKTTMAINLAMALADAGRRVTVVEADLRRPKVTEYLQLVSGVGLTNLLAGTADLDDVAQQVGDRDLYVIAAGPTPPNPSELLGSSSMATLLEKLRSENDYVIVDAAPLLPVADSWGLAAHTDGVLLSVRHGSTRMEQLAEAGVAIARVGAKLLGVVLNMVPLKGELAAAHAQGYDYGYAADRLPTGSATPSSSAEAARSGVSGGAVAKIPTSAERPPAGSGRNLMEPAGQRSAPVPPVPAIPRTNRVKPRRFPK